MSQKPIYDLRLTQKSNGAEEFFNSLTKDLPIQYKYFGELKGKGIISKESFNTDDIIFDEKPLVAMQHLFNKDYMISCQHCFRLTGSIDSQLKDLLLMEEEDQEDTSHLDTVCPLQNQLPFEAMNFDEKDANQKRIACSCGEYYCSLKCQKEAWNSYHQLLCTSAVENSPFIQFANHAQETNEIFLMVARVIATIVCKYMEIQSLEQSSFPFDIFCKLPWWEIGALSESQEGEVPDDYREIFRSLLIEATNLLNDGIQKRLETYENVNVHEIMKACERVLSVDYFACVVGTFELNSISLEIPHPLSYLACAIDEMSDKSKQQRAIGVFVPYMKRIQNAFVRSNGHCNDNCCGDSSTEHCQQIPEPKTTIKTPPPPTPIEPKNQIEDTTVFSTEIFPMVEGTSLFSIICSLNHSCDPNCQVSYSPSGRASVRAIRPIQEGDELCISYIEEDQPYADRQEDLREYQFQCQCERCISEQYIDIGEEKN